MIFGLLVALKNDERLNNVSFCHCNLKLLLNNSAPKSTGRSWDMLDPPSSPWGLYAARLAVGGTPWPQKKERPVTSDRAATCYPVTSVAETRIQLWHMVAAKNWNTLKKILFFHNHGSVENGGISKISFNPFNLGQFSTFMIIGERVYSSCKSSLSRTQAFIWFVCNWSALNKATFDWQGPHLFGFQQRLNGNIWQSRLMCVRLYIYKEWKKSLKMKPLA